MSLPPPLARPLSAMRRFLSSGASGGIVLMAVAAVAIAAANSPLAPAYFGWRDSYLGPLSTLHWINDGLMALFFLLVGLEVKREWLDGELMTWERRRLPGIAALAGMVVPAAIYIAVNISDPTALRGWAIPAATDIAFALGVLALVGRCAPASLKVFLTAVAVIDDIGAVTIIALFYTADIDMTALALALGGVAALGAINLMGVKRLWVYLLPAPFIWWAMLQSGVHATIAGVLIALTVPIRTTPGAPESGGSPLHVLEHKLAPFVAFLVIPVFGFANAGVRLVDLPREAFLDGITIGIVLGLFVGKQLGILGAVRLAVAARLVDLPANATWRQTYGVSLLCGIGFTMSLFIGELAFAGDMLKESEVKLGVLAGSILSALVGALVLRGAGAPRIIAAAGNAPAARGSPG